MMVLENVSKTYSEGVDALNNVSLSIEKGEFVFVVGPSGSGKSTLIKLMLKELEPTSGKLCIAGQQLSKLKRRQVSKYRRNIGVVFQNFELLGDRNVYENVALAQRVIGVPKRKMKKNISSMLSLVGIADKAMAFPDELSGGERQRVALARALVNRPSILLADEPTGNLDPKNAWSIMGLLDEVNKLGTTVIVVTHNPEVVDTMQKRVIAIKDGVVVLDELKGGYIYERR
ncbi:MAG: cell division ATP-binding protein FtsE [Lachnospiraceae bacterium]|nr:cell division ATP-binding protein FtsE [Lachnospiraceae bacterium]